MNNIYIVGTYEYYRNRSSRCQKYDLTYMHIAVNCFLFSVYHEGTCNTNENAGFQLLEVNTDAFTKEIEVRHFQERL